MRKKILFTASTWSHISHFHLPYLKAFHELGWEVHVACAGEKRDIPYADRCFSLPLKKAMTSPENFKATLLLRRGLREQRYDILSCHTALAACFARLAVLGLKNRPTVVNTCHGYLFDDETPFGKRMLLLAAEKVTAPVTDLLMTMNGYDYALACQHHLGKKIVAIPGMGVDFSRISGDNASLRQRLGFSEEKILLLYGAEFSKRKNQAMLIRTMKRLPEEFCLLLPGDGALRQDCMALAKELHLEKRVVFPGYVAMGEWLAACDAVASSSRSEGLPFHMMEAMAAGKPVAASRVKGHTDLVQEGKNGYLFGFDREDEAAEALLRLSSPEIRARLGKAAQESVQPYSLSSVLPVIMAEYEKLPPFRQ